MKKMYKRLLLAIGVLGVNSLSWGQCFSPASDYSVSRRPDQVVVGDFNGDSRLDLATVNTVSNNISVLLNVGGGSFGAASNFFVGGVPTSVAVGDLNGDNKLDLLTSTLNEVVILLGDGAGNFGNIIKIRAGFILRQALIEDFNGDGKPDIAVNSRGFDNVPNISVLLNNGNGSFGAAIITNLIPFPNRLTTGDFNGDGKLDMIIANGFTNNTNGSDKGVTVLSGNGDGSFGNAIEIRVNDFVSGIAARDINADGKLDLIATGSITSSIILGDGSGSFSGITTLSGAFDPVLGDFNRDGKLDLTTYNGENMVSVRIGIGDGNFGPSFNTNVGEFPSSIASGDFNGDSVLDLAVATYGTRNPFDSRENALVSVLINCTTPTTGLTLAQPAYDCNTGQLTLPTTGGNGQPIEYRIAGLRDWSGSNVFTIPTYQRTGTTFTLEARQSGQIVSLPFTSACQTTTPTPPVPPTPPVTPPTPPTGSGLSLAGPAYDCNTGELALSITGGDGQLVEYRVAGLRDWAAGNTFTVPSYQRTGTNFTLEARQGGQVVSLAFTSACQTTTPPVTPPTPPAGTPLTVTAQSLDCQTGALQLVTAGGDGTAVEFKVPGLRDYAASASFTVPTYQRSGTSFTLFARQSGREVTATYTATCPVGARLGSSEATRTLVVVVYPNPVGAEFTVGVSGAAGESVRFELTNLAGLTVVEQRADVVSDEHTETLRMPASGSGMYLLRVSTNGWSQTVKVLKP